MDLRGGISLAARCLVGAALLSTASAGRPQSADGYSSGRPTVDLHVCNRSGRNATVAISYVEVGDRGFINRGWFNVANGSCEMIATTDNANFYLYGEATDGSDRVWEGSHNLCVIYPGPYTFTSDGSTTCAYGQELRGFIASHAEEPGTFTWNLDP